MFMFRGYEDIGALGLGDLGEDWSTMEADEPPAGNDRGAAATYCGKKFGVQSPDFQPCVDFYAGPHIGEYIPKTPTVSTPNKLLSTTSKAGIVNQFLKQTTTLPQAQHTAVGAVWNMIAPGNVPWYKTPLGIGALLLGGFVVFRKLTR